MQINSVEYNWSQYALACDVIWTNENIHAAFEDGNPPMACGRFLDIVERLHDILTRNVFPKFNDAQRAEFKKAMLKRDQAIAAAREKNVSAERAGNYFDEYSAQVEKIKPMLPAVANPLQQHFLNRYVFTLTEYSRGLFLQDVGEAKEFFGSLKA